MSFFVNKPKTGAGAPKNRSRFAYLAKVENILSFPPTDASEVNLVGSIVLKPNTGWEKVYITNTSQEYTYEPVGEKDQRANKVKFIGSHPGSEIAALEFAKKNLDHDYIVVLPGCSQNEKGKVLGTPCAPLTFKSDHKGSKEGDKFNFTFEQEIPSSDVYLIYSGELQDSYLEISGPAGYGVVADGIYRIQSGGSNGIISVDNGDLLPGDIITLIGQDVSGFSADRVVNGNQFVTIGTEDWVSYEGSQISFRVYEVNGSNFLVELARK